MQWKKIKTLYILCFLILDIYLLLMFVNKQSASEFAMPDTSSSTFEEQLEAEDISISADLPDGEFNAPYLSLNQKTFTDEELTFFEETENQQTEVINENFIFSRFEKPVAIPEDADGKLISKIVKSSILLSDHYTFGSWNKEMNILVFFQQKNGLPIYYTQNGIVLVYLNDDNEMIFYTQTMLGEDESPSEEKSLIEPRTAIQALFTGNSLEYGDEITGVNMGLHRRIQVDSGEQVFSPTWTVTVNDEEYFYVNAIENLIASSDEQTFLLGSITSTIEQIQKSLDDDSEIKDFALSHLNEILTSNQQSESEIE
ncbi:MAG TPA: two-component system regulatory protein YycI [Lentibacillus sp.]|uniref:two-component system regulatory protein YycI n=1 Tax=Lentibacillus sp. TaxID=1925746 RepID=UPI002B4B164A|nr:two-component system regulatory protein YycI [Lentibacillus sp.]HLR61232.1 two-component system regulatory protein YycI [Lentibacillus sp.]